MDIFFAALNSFNQTREDEEHTIGIRLASSADERWIHSEKVEILNKALLDLGYGQVDLTSPEFRFDLSLARERRRAAFENLNPGAYPSAILDTP